MTTAGFRRRAVRAALLPAALLLSVLALPALDSRAAAASTPEEAGEQAASDTLDPPARPRRAPPVRVGSKKFTESVLLGETMTLLLEQSGVRAVHRRELGGTRVLWNALLRGDIDAYPDYTGTIIEEILGGEPLSPPAASPEAAADSTATDAPADPYFALAEALAPHGIGITGPLGFQNTYALGMLPETAGRLGIESIGDLRLHPRLRLGFTSEFLDRRDGWPGLQEAYGLHRMTALGLDHDLAYRGLLAGTLDVTDFYSTDAEIARYGLHVLEDDLGFFPQYQAVILYRLELARERPRALLALLRLQGRIEQDEMMAMNAAARFEREPAAVVAGAFLRRELGLKVPVRADSALRSLARTTRDHLTLVGVSLAAAVLVAVPLGVLAFRRPRLGQAVLAFAGTLQTVPALALLVFMIPLLGIGAPPAIAALFLYSLLPIVRNTHAGLAGIAPEIRESAAALGLPPDVTLLRIELPLASRAIMAGIKTSAVINVGTATLGALIGAGGYGQPILTGIRLADTGLILQGAVPAALLALAMQGLFELAERRLVPLGLRLEPGR